MCSRAASGLDLGVVVLRDAVRAQPELDVVRSRKCALGTPSAVYRDENPIQASAR